MDNNSKFHSKYGNLLESTRKREEQRAEELRLEAERLREEKAKRERWMAECEKEWADRRRLRSTVDDDGRLREYQQQAVKSILDEWHLIEKRNVMLQMPTGTGKTRLFVSLINAITATEAATFDIKGSPRFLIVTHREELVEQISDTLIEHYHLTHTILGCEEQTVGSDKSDGVADKISISSIQYLARHIGKDLQAHYDFIIIDEAHHSLAESYKLLWQAYPKAWKLGVTATPYRLKGDGFGSLYDKLIKSHSVAEFIEQGFLADYRLFTVSRTQAALQKVNRLTKLNASGDYQVKDLLEIYANCDEISFLYNCYSRYAIGKKGIIYAVNQLHAEMIAAYFAEKGVSIANIDSKTASKRRKELIAQFREGGLQVLVNVELFGEGFDCSAIEFAMLARPTKSLAMYLQQVGRALRPMPLKNEELRVKNEELGQADTDEEVNNDDLDRKVIILDCVGLYNRFGLPEMERNWDKSFVGLKKGERRRWQKLGLDSDDDGMTEIDTPRAEALRKMKRERIVSTLHTFNAKDGLWGIRNLSEEFVVKPCCKELTQTDDGWFYGKDLDGNLMIYDIRGELVFKREHSSIEIFRSGLFAILVQVADGKTVRIGPFGKNMCIPEKYLKVKGVTIHRSIEYYDRLYKTVYALKSSDVVLTSYNLTLATRIFKKMVHYLRDDVFVGLDDKIYKYSTSNVLYPVRLPESDVAKIMRMH